MVMGYIEKYQHLCWKEEKNKISGSCRCPKDLALLCDTRPISVHLELVVTTTEKGMLSRLRTTV